MQMLGIILGSILVNSKKYKLEYQYNITKNYGSALLS
jgi:hypothetical protein